MGLQLFRLLGMIAILATGFGVQPQARILSASLRPQDDKRPASELGRKSDSAAALALFGLLDCVNKLAQGRFAKGEAACSAVIALDPANFDAYKLRGYGYLLEHRFERAVADFRVALRLKANDAESLAGYGEGLSGLGKFEPAIAQFTKAITLMPKSGAYWNARCWARAGAGRGLDRALDDCNQALALSADAAGPLNSRGMVRLRLGQYQAAIADYTRSLAIQARQPSAWFGRGIARMRLGQRDAALSDIASARQGDSDIDALFVLMGVLPRDCAHAVPATCPLPAPGSSKKPDRPWLMVSLQFETDDGMMTAIEMDRLTIMLDQIATILRQPRPDGGMIVPQSDARQALFSQLSGAAARFNGLAQLACRSGRLPPRRCIGAYHPAWAVKDAYDDAAQPIADLFGHVYPVWTSLCAGHENVCRLE